MKKLLEGIELFIDWFAILLQLPYLTIAGMIVSYRWEPSELSDNIYAWLPTIGFEQIWIDAYGRLDYEIILYKELFN
jgi:hypothetical protein